MPPLRNDITEKVQRLKSEGFKNKEICELTGLTDGTVRYHLKKELPEAVVTKSGMEQWKELDEKPDWREIIEHAANGADIYNRTFPQYDFVNRKVSHLIAEK